jgi:FkbM family methyltransferase
MNVKRRMVDLANDLLKPTGLALGRAGADMRSVMRTIAATPHGITSILDLGAARGHWSAMALDLFPQARIVGVDPLSEREPYLAALKTRHPHRYDYVLAVAGETDGGNATLNVTDDLDGSTIEGGVGRERTVPVRSLDAIVAEKGLVGPYFLKFDTHGFEAPILAGATATLAQTRYMVMESYVFRHSPQTLLFHEMIGKLAKDGFRVFNAVDLMQRPIDGALWQMDLFFARENDPVFSSNRFHG